MFKWNGENPIGWFVGYVIRKHPNAGELLRCETANVVVRYYKKHKFSWATNTELDGDGDAPSVSHATRAWT